MSMNKLDKSFWEKRYQNNQTGWDVGYIATPLKDYIDQLTNKEIKILIPGAGNSHEAEYLWNNGFKNIYVLDIAEHPLMNFKNRIPDFPESRLIHDDFFEIQNTFDLIVEHTFFCALNPDLREKYASKMHDLLNSNGKLIGLLFDFELTKEGPPFGGSKKEYASYFTKHFSIKTLERAYNSIKPRQDRELFFIFDKN